jgi:hypothetical protein
MALKYLYAPSGAKAGKAYGVLPNSANADFSSFSRSSSGSRVDKNGFINTGLGLGSEEVVDGGFDNASSWVTTVATISNSRAIFIDGTGAYSNVRQLGVLTINKTYEVTIDVVINSGGGLKIQDGSGNTYKQITESGVYTFRFTSIGASSSFYIARNLGGVAYDMYVERVSVREVTEVNTDVPRIDHTGGGCPSLLLEPTSTNYFQYSQDFNQSYWQHNADITTTNSSELAPNGGLNANLIEYDGSGFSFIRLYMTVPSTAATLSVFAKKGNWRYLGLRNFQGSGNDHTVFDFDTETFSNIASGQTASFEVFPDGWYRIKVTQPSPESNSIVGFAISNSSGSESNTTGGQVANVHLFGAQLEHQSYATSYIPNYGIVLGETRSADDANSTGDISSAINNEEGVFFTYMAAPTSEAISTPQWVSLSEGSSNNSYISIRYNTGANAIQVRYLANGGSAVQMSTTSIDRSNFNKIAFRWKANDFSLWINGSLIQTQTTWDIITANNLNRLSLELPSGGQNLYGKVREIRIYDEYESDSEMAKLTTL